MNTMKYPRTYHLPWSPGATSDDKKLLDSQVTNFIGKQVIVSEKLDGSNSTITRYGVYSRSHANFTRHPWSKNLWNLHQMVKDLISEDEMIFGENLYAIHSIEYNKLTSFFHIFNICNKERWYSWDEIKEFSDMLSNDWSKEFQLVPIIFDGVLNSVDELKSLIDKTMKEPSRYGDTKEGVVIRIADEFPINDFKNNVCKYVRANHVQTNKHWTENWKPAVIQLHRQ